MKRLVRVAIFASCAVCVAFSQSGEQPKSLADIARESKVEKKDQAKVVLSEDSGKIQRPLIPDVFYGGMDNTDEILRALDEYKSNHNAQETEAVLRIWFDKHDALLASAIEENQRIEQRERDRQMGYGAADVEPRSQQEYMELQRIVVISRREDAKHKQENGLLAARIQQTFGKVRTQVRSKYAMKVEWFKIRCGNGNCSF